MTKQEFYAIFNEAKSATMNDLISDDLADYIWERIKCLKGYTSVKKA